MQSEIPLSFILEKTKQLKNNRQKKRYDKEQVKKSQTIKITSFGTASPRKGKKKTMNREDRIRMVLTGGKIHSPHKKSRSNRKKDIYEVYKQ
jgi:hypothetical protein